MFDEIMKVSFLICNECMQRRKFIQIIAEYIRYIELYELMQANFIEIAFSTAIIFDVMPN